MADFTELALMGLHSPQFIQSFLDTHPMPIYVVNTAGIIVYCNNAHAKVNDMDVSLIIGQAESKVYGPCLGPGIMRDCQESGKSINGFVCRYRTVKGKVIKGAYWVSPLYDSEGKISGSLCLTQILPSTKDMQSVPLNYSESGSEILYNYINQRAAKESPPEMPSIIGSNSEFRRMLHVAQSTATSPSPVLIYGETGCGKELVVEAIKASGNRSHKPYLAINCSAIPTSLLENILFGTTKGSFTGAVDKAGLFEEANGGTLYLDEIDSMPLELQPKLLRVLQNMRVRRLGSPREELIDVKIISSVGTAPDELLINGKLRPDLFYRLAVIALRIPPLRERKDDLNELVAHFISKYNQLLNKKITNVHPDVEKLFKTYHWPGNVRELENMIVGAINLAAWGTVLHIHHIPEHFRLSLEKPYDIFSDSWPIQLNPVVNAEQSFNEEKEAIVVALKKTKGHLSRSARLLGISRQLLAYKIKKFSIERSSFFY